MNSDERGKGKQNPLYSHTKFMPHRACRGYSGINQSEKLSALCGKGYCIKKNVANLIKKTTKREKQQGVFQLLFKSHALLLQFCNVMQGMAAERGTEPSNNPTNWSCNTQLDWRLSGKYFFTIWDNLTWDMDKWEAQRTYCCGVWHR